MREITRRIVKEKEALEYLGIKTTCVITQRMKHPQCIIKTYDENGRIKSYKNNERGRYYDLDEVIAEFERMPYKKAEKKTSYKIWDGKKLMDGILKEEITEPEIDINDNRQYRKYMYERSKTSDKQSQERAKKNDMVLERIMIAVETLAKTVK